MKKKWIRDALLFCIKTKTWKIMRLSAFFLFLCLSHAWATSGYSQSTKLTLKMNGSKVIDVLNEIENQSEFYFLFNQKLLDVERQVDINVREKPIEIILEKLFSGTSVNYHVYDRQIVLTTFNEERLSDQAKAVSGKVTDPRNLPLPGVTVVIKGTTQGTITDADGEYTLANVPDGATLVFSFVGMKAQEVVVGNKTSINISMEEETIGLDEVVAIGYGTQKKANLTGAVGIANAERLENRPIASTGHGLVGVIPNLNVSIRSGDPTARAEFNIRGFESINGGSPLVLVDGVPMDLDLVNPNDIATVNVLKDASSAAVYGARAAFGVVLVETKKGKEGLKIQLSSETSLSKPIFHMDLISSSYEYAQQRQSLYEDVGRVWINDTRMAMLKNYYDNPTSENEWTVLNGQMYYNGNTDFLNYMLADFAPQQKYDLNISGASEKASYYFSLGYMNKKGYLKNKESNLDYDRFNVLLKADFKLTDWLSLDPKIVLNAEFNDEPHFYANDRALNTIVRLTPDTPVKFPDLPYYLEPGDHDDWAQYIGMYFVGARNAPFAHNGGRDLYDAYDLWLTQGATLTPLKGLRIRSDFSYQIYNKMTENQQTEIPMVGTNLLNFYLQYGQSQPTYMQNRADYNRYYVFNTYGEYVLDQFEDHYVKAMVGFNQEWGRNQYIRALAYEMATSSIRDLNATLGDQQTAGGKSQTSLRGAFYRLNYIFRDKYLVETNGRYDLTSRFPTDSRMGFFPSVSVGWRLSNENFMGVASNWLDNLMLRASYGSLGNQLLGSNYYPYISTMGMGLRPHIFANDQISYVSPPGLVSSSLTWETVTTRNVGVDFALFNQKLEVNTDFYIRDTKDMLMKQTFPVILGTSAPDANAADLRTKGWEVSVTWRNRVNRDLSYSINLALADNQAEITKYENPTGSLSDYYVGQKIGEIWGYKTVGLFQSDEEVAAAPSQAKLGTGWQAGDVQYADLDGDKEISPGANTLSDPGDQMIIGNSSARYSFGINPQVTYKDWSLNLFFQGLFRDYFPSTSNHRDFWPYITDGFEKWWAEESWSEDNRDALFPRPRFMRVSTPAMNFMPQTRYLQNASYIRLKNITLNYDLPQNLIGRIGLEKAQVYLSGFNVWEYSKIHKPLDPEYIYTTDQEYFMQRTYSLGIKVMF
ncbi:TonB-linked outer membrane protein, SusC/RagA family [Mariniphaga anaerophila]|uniref:TonB-linked outer membrane protein, SusC/RagA family n=1 Tax=Mariniphaga anaerophila TaxID=1484053 RepID=A0A1M4ZRX0_9BACT|nr:TonB-dependent receptor [Mariniphaga anaerophila]SHF20754.1 TonB-linked outer membrane protein, SusC/RagA family [Mariniphaga anaerophila]